MFLGEDTSLRAVIITGINENQEIKLQSFLFEIIILVQICVCPWRANTRSINTKIKSCCFTLKTITTETNQTTALKAAHSFKFEHVKMSTLL